MRVSRLIVLGLVAAGIGAMPAVTHAVGYKKYTSASCGYTVDQPVGWKTSVSGTTVVFGGATSGTTYREVILDCTQKAVSEKTLTASEISAFKKQGYVLGTPKYTGHAGIFTGHKTISNAGKPITGLVEVTSFPAGKRGYVIALAADSKSWAAALNVYVHELKSFHTK